MFCHRIASAIEHRRPIIIIVTVQWDVFNMNNEQ